MLRVVIDTNVFVSAFLTGGACVEVIQNWKKGKFILLVSQEILEEILEVLSRPVIGAPASYITRFKKLIERKAKMVKPYLRVQVARHQADNKFIECALGGKGGVIVSGDPHLQVIGTYQGISIISPREFLYRLK
ncbi:MAG: putative toxin-antitoxin system toxin component, PIN family [Armatimonadetes bacterium]|nr:putative toxin-antitoxin system toxin component, PIN family [Armatimonadota bacterium]